MALTDGLVCQNSTVTVRPRTKQTLTESNTSLPMRKREPIALASTPNSVVPNCTTPAHDGASTIFIMRDS